jgi:hypothetical protein
LITSYIFKKKHSKIGFYLIHHHGSSNIVSATGGSFVIDGALSHPYGRFFANLSFLDNHIITNSDVDTLFIQSESTSSGGFSRPIFSQRSSGFGFAIGIPKKI